MSALVWIGLLGSALTLTRLVASNLWRRYFWFSAWTASNILKAAAIAYITDTFGNSSRIYVTTWQLCHAMTALLLIAAGREAYLRIANDYPRIGNYGRRVLLWSSLAAIIIALAPVGADTFAERFRTPTLLIGVLSRSSAIAVLFGLWFAVSHIRSVPIPERKNLLRHRRLLMLYCAGQALGMSALLYTGDRSWAVLYMGTTAICWWLWPWLMTSKGEDLVRREYTEDDRLHIRAAVGEIKALASEQADQARARH